MKPYIISYPSDDQIAAHHRGLRAHNAKFVTNTFTKVKAVITNKADRVIAGIDGEAYWGKLHIDNLWVDPDHRRHGLGSELMIWAEQQGKALGCNAVVLDTMSFQALEFYLITRISRIRCAGKVWEWS